MTGHKVGACVPVLCEIEAGIQQVAQPDVYRLNLERLLRQIRVWRIDPSTARVDDDDQCVRLDPAANR